MSLPLTDEQLAIVNAHPKARVLVTAGPGTGKTHTLVARLSYLVEEHAIPPAAGVLALSFSRAAVGELRRRLRETGEDAGRITPVTFDSMATRILAEVDPDGSWTERSYDGRIEAATEQIPAFVRVLENVEHICVDEVQDLVGVRLHFVRALLEAMGAGFTLLGDPAQGIYDFSLPDGGRIEIDGSPVLYRWVRDHYREDLADLSLTTNHRAKSKPARAAAALGPAVVADPAAGGGRLVDLLAEAPRMSSIGMLRNLPSDGRTAILCRSNGDALWISRQLNREGIGHVLQRSATNRSIAPWVAEVLTAGQGDTISKDRLARVLSDVAGSAPDIEEAWRLLRRVARDSSGGLDLDRLARQIRIGRVPDELHSHRTAPIVVSTVHRAKGLEFERVFIVDEAWSGELDDEAAKTLFVAASRSIDSLGTLGAEKGGAALRKDKWTDRWTSGTRREHWKRLSIEVLPDDVDATAPPGSSLISGDVVEIQKVLRDQARPGDEVVLHLVRPNLGAPGAIYRALWNETPIALMSDRFGIELMRVLKASKKWAYPNRIEGLRIDAIRTVAGEPLVTNAHGLGMGGAWLAPTLVGLGSFIWERNAENG